MLALFWLNYESFLLGFLDLLDAVHRSMILLCFSMLLISDLLLRLEALREIVLDRYASCKIPVNLAFGID